MLDTLDAAAVRRWCAAGWPRCARHQGEIDELNVYPVPDGDTGTNLVLTLTSAQQALVDETSTPCRRTAPTAHGHALRLMARGALLGARGNSGVILSQILRGLADALAVVPPCAAGSWPARCATPPPPPTPRWPGRSRAPCSRVVAAAADRRRAGRQRRPAARWSGPRPRGARRGAGPHPRAAAGAGPRRRGRRRWPGARACCSTRWSRWSPGSAPPGPTPATAHGPPAGHRRPGDRLRPSTRTRCSSCSTPGRTAVDAAARRRWPRWATRWWWSATARDAAEPAPGTCTCTSTTSGAAVEAGRGRRPAVPDLGDPLRRPGRAAPPGPDPPTAGRRGGGRRRRRHRRAVRRRGRHGGAGQPVHRRAAGRDPGHRRRPGGGAAQRPQHRRRWRAPPPGRPHRLGVRVSVVPTRSPVQALAALAVRDPRRPVRRRRHRDGRGGRRLPVRRGLPRQPGGADRRRPVPPRRRAGAGRGGGAPDRQRPRRHLRRRGRPDARRRRRAGHPARRRGRPGRAGRGGPARTSSRRWPFVEVQAYPGGQPHYPLLVGVE